MAKRAAEAIPSQHNLIDFPEYVSAIGMVSLETGDLQIKLANLFSRMVGVTVRIGQSIFLSPKAEHARIDILLHAAHAKFAIAPKANPKAKLVVQNKRDLNEVVKIVKRSHDLINKRHRIIHDDWNM